jgi:hypothetical protein
MLISKRNKKGAEKSHQCLHEGRRKRRNKDYTSLTSQFLDIPSSKAALPESQG